jgi:hypothetical protein
MLFFYWIIMCCLVPGDGSYSVAFCPSLLSWLLPHDPNDPFVPYKIHLSLFLPKKVFLPLITIWVSRLVLDSL